MVTRFDAGPAAALGHRPWHQDVCDAQRHMPDDGPANLQPGFEKRGGPFAQGHHTVFDQQIRVQGQVEPIGDFDPAEACLLYTSDAADE